jgi:hypothetical protein
LKEWAGRRGYLRLPLHGLEIGLGIVGVNVLLKLMQNPAKPLKYHPVSIGEWMTVLA